MLHLVKMLRLFVIVFSINAISALPSRIIHGETIEIEDAPFQVSLIRSASGSHSCGGSIVSPNYILTAGHCAGLAPSGYLVRSGSSFWNRGGQLHEIVEVIKHEKYGSNEFGSPLHDVALMRVKPAFKIDGLKRKKLELFENGWKAVPGQSAVVTGWGRTENGTLADQLQRLAISIVSKAKCNEAYKEYGGLPKGQICAAHPTGLKDMCNGDSGGPLVINGRQAGIVSWSGPGCALPQYPGVYTEVAAYYYWIKKHLKEEN